MTQEPDALGTTQVIPPPSDAVPASTDDGDVTPPPPVEPTAEPEERGENKPVLTTEKEEANALPTFSERLEQLTGENDTFRTEYDELQQAKHQEGYKAAQERLHPLYERIRQNTERLNETSQGIVDGLKELFASTKALEDGGISAPGELTTAIAKHAPRLAESLAGLTELKGRYDGYDWLIYQLGEFAEDKDLADTFRRKMREAQLGGAANDEQVMIAHDLFDELSKAIRKQGGDSEYRRGLRETTKSATRVAKSEQRAGAGPDMAATGGVPPDKRSENEILLDPLTPIAVIKEIRDRQKKVGL